MHRFAHGLVIAAALSTALAFPARAECYVDYKAKQDDPLRFHYGVSAIPDDICDNAKAARPLMQGRLAQDGWTLIKILGFFGPEGLDERKQSAGENFLRY